MLAAYNIRRSSVVLNPHRRVLRGLGDGDGGGGDGGGGDGGGGDGTGDSGSGDSSSGNVDAGLDLGDGLTAANDAVAAQANSDAEAAIDAVTQADAAAKAAAEADADAANVNAINLALSLSSASSAAAQALGNAAAKGALSFLGLPGVVIGVLSASGLISAGVNAALSGNSSTASASVSSAIDSASGGVDITNAPASVKTTVAQVKDAAAAVKTVMQYNNYDLTSPAYKRFLPENGGQGIPALYKEIRDFISTHNKAEIDQAMQASGVSNADVIAAFQAAGVSQPGSGSNLAFLAAIAASYFVLGA